ncbi:Hypothetical protein, putative [Bodo saltans]|uniref:Uncharacterized protein n=1 Tax=Bodo saltans TaxID=75058 RepID=A0A0S4J232_BODSA|nr:Hypothetical protein, putative [Bodo saltans]|eukprot:CUG84127.1 Hypothetical protein, putative [Bodo saltans]
MQRAISTEHIADFAQHAVNSIRRLMSSSNFDSMTPSQQDLSSTSKQIEDLCVKKHGGISKLDSSVIELYSKSFADELDLLMDANGLKEGGMPSSSQSSLSTPDLANTPSSPSARTGSAGQSVMKPMNDALFLQATECLKHVSRSFGQRALEAFQNAQLLEHLLKWFLASSGNVSKKMYDAVHVALQEVFGELSGALRCGMGVLFTFLQHARTPSELAAPAHLRALYFFIGLIRRSDVSVSVTAVEQARNRPFEQELVQLLLGHIRLLQGALDVDQHPTSHSTATTGAGRLTTCSVMSISLIHCLIRGSTELKRLVLSEPDIRGLWSFVATQCGRMDVIMTQTAHVGNKSEDRAMSFDTIGAWAGDLAEMLLELCTTDSFSLRRQSLYAPESAAPPTPPSVRSGLPTGRGGQGASIPAPPAGPSASRRWEVLPTNWDVTLTTGATAVWRFASVLSGCKIPLTSVRPLLQFIGSLDTASNPTADYIFRCVCASLLLLCNASPVNVSVLSEAGALGMIIEMLTDPATSAFPRRQDVSPLIAHGAAEAAATIAGSTSFDDPTSPASTKLSEASRQLVLSLLSILASQHFKSQDLSMFLCAVEAMRQHQTTAEDCEVIEHMLNTVGNTIYTKQLLFYGGDASAICPVDRFAGRWYGYTFSAWINPLCVWSEGCALYSYADPSTPSAVVICLVANGRSRSLAIRTFSNKDFSIALIPDTALAAEAWNHIAIVHNITGFTVYINGRKTSNSTNPPFPKEPSRPHKLLFGLGTDCSFVDAAASAAAGSGQGSSLPVDSNSGSSGAVISSGTPNRVPSFYGYVTGFELLDGALNEKDVERIANHGPETRSQLAEPAHSIPTLIAVVPSAKADEVEWLGSVLKKDSPLVKLSGITPYEVPDVPGTFVSLGVVSWATDVLRSIDHKCANRNIIAVLCAEFLSTTFKLAKKEELTKYQDMGILDDVRRILLQWGNTCPAEFTNSLLSIAVPRGSGKQMRTNPSTSRILNIVLDLLARPGGQLAFYQTTLKDLSELLSNSENAKLFKEQSTRFTTLLMLSSALPVESIQDFVSLVEKLFKEPAELEQLLRFLAYLGPSRHNEMVACELLRMLYDVARPTPVMCDVIANAFNGTGVVWLVYLIHGTRHRSEATRVCTMKLLALVLHCSRKAREVFTKVNGFDMLTNAVIENPHQLATTAELHLTSSASPSAAAAAVPPAAAVVAAASSSSGPSVSPAAKISVVVSDPSSLSSSHQHASNLQIPVRLMTYNYLFKFALDFYTPNSDSGSSDGQQAARPKHADPTRASGSAAVFGFHGHLPGVIPLRAARRGLNVDLGYGNEFGDVEGRLSVDENYSAQTVSKDRLVHPQVVHTVLLLLGQAIRQLLADSAASGLMSDEPSKDGLSEEHQSIATPSVSNSKREDDTTDAVLKVLAYLDRIVDLTPNASVLVTQPWLEWLWVAVEPLFAASGMNSSPLMVDTSSNASCAARQLLGSAEPIIRSIIRKVCVVDLSKGSKTSHFRKVVKEHMDEPILQQLVLEEIVRHFSENNRLDTMDPSEATYCIRNLDGLLQNIDECVMPFPNSLAFEIVFAIRRIAVNNNTWVRLKMKSSTKLFEIRDRLAFMLLTSIKEFSKEDEEFIRSLIDANIQDVNTLHVVLKGIVDAVQQRNLEEVETLQGVLRLVYSLELEQRKALQKLLDTDSVELLQQREKAGAGTPTNDGSSAATDFISWCMKNESKWETMTQRILRGYRPVESEVKNHNDKREKERASKMKIVKADVDKKYVGLLKGAQELEKVRGEIDGKSFQQFSDWITECKLVRTEQEGARTA